MKKYINQVYNNCKDCCHYFEGKCTDTNVCMNSVPAYATDDSNITFTTNYSGTFGSQLLDYYITKGDKNEQ